MRLKTLESETYGGKREGGMKEKLLIKLVMLLPRSVIYWAGIRLMVHATQGEYSNQVVPELTAMETLRRWKKNNQSV